ncbi:MAG: multidrug efflux RND transporter periplasmic adaptor subunit VexE [Alphaproteobacteria bacterium]
MNRSVVIAIVIALASVAWIASGQIALSEDSSDGVEVAATPQPSPRAVRTRDSQAEEVVTELNLAGRTTPDRQVDIRAKRGGTVAEILAEKGEAVTEDKVLVRLTEDSYRIAVEAATAQRKQRQIQFDAARRLSQRGFESTVRTAETAAELATAIATLSEAELALERSEIASPFAGILHSRAVEMGDFVENGQVVATVVDLNPLKISAYVSEANLPRLDKDAPVQVAIPGYGEHQASISYVSPVADPATRTFRIELTLPNDDLAIPAGVTSALTLPVSRRRAHVMSPALLTLADDGGLGVKLVEADGHVRFVPVTILGEKGDGIAVTGLPDQATIITVGQDFVANGERVHPVDEGEIAARQKATADEAETSQ